VETLQRALQTAGGRFADSSAEKRAVSANQFFNSRSDNITKLQVVLNGDVKRSHKRHEYQLLCKRGMNELGLDPNRFDFVADYSDDPLERARRAYCNEFTVTPTLAAALSTTKTLVGKISKVYLGKRVGPPRFKSSTGAASNPPAAAPVKKTGEN